jgi:hypothetical protein
LKIKPLFGATVMNVAGDFLISVKMYAHNFISGELQRILKF